MPVILTTDRSATRGCGHRGMRRRRCSGRCRMMRWRSWCAARIRKIGRQR